MAKKRKTIAKKKKQKLPVKSSKKPPRYKRLLAPQQLLDMNVLIVTSKAGSTMNGCTASWITRLSMAPPLVGVSIGKERLTHLVISQKGMLVLNMLDKRDWTVAKYFGTVSGRTVNKFKKYPCTFTSRDNPVLKKAKAYVECEVKNRFDMGDHTLFICEIVQEKMIKSKFIPLTRMDVRKHGL